MKHAGIWGVAQGNVDCTREEQLWNVPSRKQDTHKFQLTWKPVVFQNLNHTIGYLSEKVSLNRMERSVDWRGGLSSQPSSATHSLLSWASLPSLSAEPFKLRGLGAQMFSACLAGALPHPAFCPGCYPVETIWMGFLTPWSPIVFFVQWGAGRDRIKYWFSWLHPVTSSKVWVLAGEVVFWALSLVLMAFPPSPSWV